MPQVMDKGGLTDGQAQRTALEPSTGEQVIPH